MKRVWNLATLWARPRPQVGVTPASVVHRENKWRLLRYAPAEGGPRHDTPILLVPSLINRHYVLDLTPGKSFAEFLVAQGFDVLAIDWGTPGPEDRLLEFDTIVDGYLGRAVRCAAQHGRHGKVHLLGYCMGGTFTAIHAALHPERVASMVALAAPVRFEDESLLSQWTRSRDFDVDALVDASGLVPWQLMQGAFAMLRPTLGASKTVHLVDRAWNDQFLDGFFALETWANDNVSLPGEFYRRYIHDLYRGDALAKGTLVVSGRAVKLAQLTAPTLAVVFEHDTIAPWQSCAAVVDLCGAQMKAVWKLPGSHVGGVVSSGAAKTLWPALAAWWAEQS